MLNFYEGHKVYMNGEYPAIFLNGKNQHVHRLEWIKHHGDIPDGCIIHHKDEDKTNWNIDNLELLKRSEHILKHVDGMHPIGSYGGEKRKHKLTQEDVDYIRTHHQKYSVEYGARALANKFNVTEQCVYRIVNGITWKDVM